MVCCLVESSSLEALILDVETKVSHCEDHLVPYEPSAAIRISAILLPRTKVMTTCKILLYEGRKVDVWNMNLLDSPSMCPRLENSAAVREIPLISARLRLLN